MTTKRMREEAPQDVRLRMNEPLISELTHKYVQEVLDSGWISVEGPKVKLLEKGMAKLLGGVDSVAVQSGTAAIWGAVKALGVTSKSDVVICCGYTCAATADGIVAAGGTPLICDVEEQTFGLSLAAVEAALASPKWGSAIVGVCIVSCYGVPARDTVAIAELCKARGLWLCEDAAESYGAQIEAADGNAVPVGSIGDIAAMSIRSEKMVGCGEGGVIVSKTQSLVDKARWWCSRAPTQGVGKWRVYEHDEVGMNYRLPELLGAVALAGLEKLPMMIQRKAAIHGWYLKYLDPLLKSAAGTKYAGLAVQQTGNSADEAVWWLNVLVLPASSPLSAEEVGAKLATSASNIETRPAFYALSWMKPFRETAMPCPVAEGLFRRIIALPSSHLLQEEQVEFICDRVREVLQ